jgi:multicomponent Na+:H+ antiporter subunit F
VGTSLARAAPGSGTAVGGPVMFVLAIFAIVVTMFLALARALLGPTVFDRLMAVNMFGTKTVLLIAVSGFLTGRPEWLDLALLYTLVNFTGTLAVCRYVRFGNVGLERGAVLDDSSLEGESER